MSSADLVRAFSAVAVIFLAGCATHVGKPNAMQPAQTRTSFQVFRDIVYTPSGWPEALVADLYRPEISGLRPAVLLLHGGGWKVPERRRDMRSIAEKLARRGYVVLNATYRMTPRWQYPAPVDDLREAIRWLRAHSAEHGVDPARVAAFGYSAGGHLAALLGVLEGPPDTRVQAVVAGGAPSDLTLYAGGELVPAFLGGTQAQVPARFREASPVTHVSVGDPPFFIYHGTWDRLVIPEHARRLSVALTKAGVRHELYWLKARAHISGFLLEGGSEDAAIDFFDREIAARGSLTEKTEKPEGVTPTKSP